MNRSLSSLLPLLSLVAVSLARADAAPEPGGEAAQAPVRISGAINDEPAMEERRLIPPYLHERRGDVTTTAFFPFYFARTNKAGQQRFILPYYYRREAKRQVDVALALIWSLRGPDRHTFVLPPFYSHHSGKDRALGLLPLFSAGVFGDHRHTVIPPLLTWFDADKDKHRRFVGPYYDVKLDHARWRGLFPLIWNKRDASEGFLVVPPLFFRFTEEDPFAATTVVPPFYHVRRKDETSWGLVPLLFHGKSPELNTTTVPLALFHHARGPKRLRLVTPLFVYLDEPEHGRTWVTPIYQRRRGNRNFDGVAPLLFRAWDDRDGSRSLYLPPIYWHSHDPANRTDVVFPLFARNHRDGISDFWLVPLLGRKKSLEREQASWWAAPTFHWGWEDADWYFNIHPVFYLKRSPQQDHFAFAPLWFDFNNRKEQTHRRIAPPLYWDFQNFKEQKKRRVLFPLYWDFANGKAHRHHRVAFPLYWDFDFRDRETRYTVAFPFYARSIVGDRTRHFALNTMVERQRGGERRWQFHFFPLVQSGGSVRDKWWSVLYGLAGYDRRGGHRRARVFWIPFQLRD